MSAPTIEVDRHAELARIVEHSLDRALAMLAGVEALLERGDVERIDFGAAIILVRITATELHELDACVPQLASGQRHAAAS